MAGKEATVFIVDVGQSMGRVGPGRSVSDLSWALDYLWDKFAEKVLAGRKTDYAAVLALRSDRTDNRLQSDAAYANISTPLAFPDRSRTADGESTRLAKRHIDILHPEIAAPSSTDTGDALSAVILAIDMLNIFCSNLKFAKNIVLLTNADVVPIDFADAEQVASQLREKNIALSVFGVDFDDAQGGVKEEVKSPVKAENERQLRALCDSCSGVYATMQEVIESLANPKVREVRPVPTFKGMLSLGHPDIGHAVEIAVERYPRTKQAKPVSATKMSILSDRKAVLGNTQSGSVDQSTTGRVRTIRNYKLETTGEDVDLDSLEKGYNYGRTIIPFSKVDEQMTKFVTVAGLVLLGFLVKKDHPRQMSMGEASVIVAKRGSSHDALALSSLVHALYEQDMYALGRLVKKDNAAAQMVVLAPEIKPGFECLVEVGLPFAEDVRAYRFAPLDRIKTTSGAVLDSHRYLPSKELDQAMSDYVDSMDLVGEQKDEHGNLVDVLEPEDTYSFAVHRLNQAISYRASHPNEPFPPPAPKLVQFMKPLPHIAERAAGPLAALQVAAGTKRVPPRAGHKRKRPDDPKPISGIDIEALLGQEPPPLETEPNPATVTDIGEENPASDFEAMMAVDDLIDEGFAQIQQVIPRLIQDSLGDQLYELAIQAITTFRKHSKEQEEAGLFNSFLRDLRKRMQASGRQDFLKQLGKSGTTLLTDEEAGVDDLHINHEQAQKFTEELIA